VALYSWFFTLSRMGKLLAAVKERLTATDEEQIRIIKARASSRMRRGPRRSAGTAMGGATGNRGLSLMPHMRGVQTAGPVDSFPTVNAGGLSSGGSFGSSSAAPRPLTDHRLPRLNLADLTDAPAPNTRAISRPVRMRQASRLRVGRAAMIRVRR
jgi:hypothetical protein